MNLLTIIVIGYLTLAMARAFYFGFIKTVFSMFFLVLVISSTFILAKPVTGMLNGSENVRDYVAEKSEEFIDHQTDRVLGGLSDGSEAGNLTFAIVGSALQLNGVKTIAAERLSEVIMNVLGMLGAGILSIIFWVIVEVVLMYLTRGQFVGILNRLLGLALGTVRGVVIVWIAFGIISALQFTPTGRLLMNQITESAFLTWLNEWNIVSKYIPHILLSLI